VAAVVSYFFPNNLFFWALNKKQNEFFPHIYLDDHLGKFWIDSTIAFG
jgi:hypothetical protein